MSLPPARREAGRGLRCLDGALAEGGPQAGGMGSTLILDNLCGLSAPQFPHPQAGGIKGGHLYETLKPRTVSAQVSTQ